MTVIKLDYKVLILLPTSTENDTGLQIKFPFFAGKFSVSIMSLAPFSIQFCVEIRTLQHNYHPGNNY